MIRVIAFLGKLPINARPVSYTYGDAVYQGTVFPQVLRQFIEYDEMNVFVTAEALTSAWSHLEGLDDARIKAVEIPDGRTPEERWLIFDKLRNVVQDGDTVIFDITHGYRTLFFSAFLAIAFLKSARENVTVRRVLYGELGQEGAPGPVIDLTDYVSLLDWMSATDQFVDFGNSQPLVQLVADAPTSAADDAADRHKLNQFARSLDNVSRSLQLVMPDKAMIAAHDLLDKLDQAREPMARQLRPFVPLADRVERAFAGMAQAAGPRDQAGTWRALEQERDIIFWYLERQLLLQAINLAFEWLISYGMVHRGCKDLSLYDEREQTKNYYMTLKVAQRRPAKAAGLDEAKAALGKIEDVNRVVDLFIQAKNIRNSLLHASKSVRGKANKDTPAQWEEKIREVCHQLADLPLSKPEAT